MASQKNSNGKNSGRNSKSKKNGSAGRSLWLWAGCAACIVGMVIAVIFRSTANGADRSKQKVASTSQSSRSSVSEEVSDDSKVPPAPVEPEISKIDPNPFKEVEKRETEPEVVYQTFVVSWTLQLKTLVDFVEKPAEPFSAANVKNLGPQIQVELERLNLAMKVARREGAEMERNLVLKEVDRLEKEMDETATEHDHAKLIQVVYLIRDLLQRQEAGVSSSESAEKIELSFSQAEAKHFKDIDAAMQEKFAITLQIPQEEEKVVRAAMKVTDEESNFPHFASAYGEVTSIGLRRIGHAMGVSGDDGVSTTGAQAVFMDLGSGFGRVVAQAYLEWPAVRRSIGVELSATRSKHAWNSWQSLLDSGVAEKLRKASEDMAIMPDGYTSDVYRSVEFLQEDLMLTDISEATHVFVNSILFPNSFLEQISEKLAGEGTKICMVASFKDMPLHSQGFEKVGSFNAEQSWSTTLETAPVLHLYSRDGCGKRAA